MITGKAKLVKGICTVNTPSIKEGSDIILNPNGKWGGGMHVVSQRCYGESFSIKSLSIDGSIMEEDEAEVEWEIKESNGT